MTVLPVVLDMVLDVVLDVVLGMVLGVVLGATALVQRLKLEMGDLCVEKLNWAPAGAFSYCLRSLKDLSYWQMMTGMSTVQFSWDLKIDNISFRAVQSLFRSLKYFSLLRNFHSLFSLWLLFFSFPLSNNHYRIP